MTADGTGAWSATVALGVAAGAQETHAHHRLDGGRGRQPQGPGDEPSVTVDRIAPTPAAPSAPDLDAGSDSGTLDSDNLTNLARPHHRRQRGGGHAGACSANLEGPLGAGPVTADGTGAWSATVALGVAAGAQETHLITASTVDAAGNRKDRRRGPFGDGGHQGPDHPERAGPGDGG